MRYLFFIVLLFPTFLRAQLRTLYEPGVVTFEDGKIAKGFILRSSDSKMATNISFTTSPAGKSVVNYEAKEIKSVVFEDGLTFEKISVNTGNGNNITTLGHLLLTGKVNLYSFQNAKNRCYLVKKGGTDFILQDDERLNDGTLVRHYFKNLLVVVTNDVPGFKKDTEKMTFSERQILNFLLRYNTASGESFQVSRPKDNFRGFFIVSAGRSIFGNSLKTTPEVTFQADYRMLMPRISRTTSLAIGFHAYSFQYSYTLDSGKYRSVEIGDQITYAYIPAYYSLHEKGQLFNVPFQIQQSLSAGRLRPYFLAGFNIYYRTMAHDPDNGILTKRSGFNPHFGAGLEWNIYAGLMCKLEYRNEGYSHPLLLSLAYCVGRR